MGETALNQLKSDIQLIKGQLALYLWKMDFQEGLTEIRQILKKIDEKLSIK